MQEKIIKYRALIVITAIVITLLSFFTFPNLKVNANLDDYVPDSVKNKVHLKTLDSIFGGSEVILVMLHTEDVINASTLNRLESMSIDLCGLEGIDNCISPFDVKAISYEDELTSIDPFFETISEQDTNFIDLKQRVSENTMAQRFFSEDFSLISLVLTKNTQTPDTIIDDIKNVIEQHPGEEEVIIGGLPFIRHSISGYIQNDIIYLLPIAMLLMVFMLYFSFKEWKGVFMPFIVVLMSVILSFAVMSLFGWQISLFSILMPIMIIAIANDYGIHLIARYQELIWESENYSMKQICKQIYIDLKWPILITGVTTIGGVLGLLTHTMIPAAQLGILTAIGLAFSLLLSLWFLPALLSYFKPSKAFIRTSQERKSFIDIWLNRLGNWVTNYPKRILIGTVFISLIGVLGVSFLRVDTNIESYFAGESDVKHSIEVINDKFGGAQFISILFSGDVLSPEVINNMETYEKELVKNPHVGLVSSPATLIKELSKGFYNPEESGYNKIPATSDEIYQLLEIFLLSGDEEAITQFLDYDYENARMLISLKDVSNSGSKSVVELIELLTKNDENIQFVAGSSLTEIELADLVVDGQIKSLIFAMLIIFLILSIVFKSPKAGLLSSLPLSIAILVLFGFMGLFGISLDIANALLSSIMIGVGIDYTIHFLWRFKTERSQGLSHSEAVKETLSTSGRGIVINAVSVIIGFLPLILSNFTPLKFFGALIVISIATCLISSLLLIPAIVILTKPKFLEKQ